MSEKSLYDVGGTGYTTDPTAVSQEEEQDFENMDDRYYTKDEVNQGNAAQDSRITAVENKANVNEADINSLESRMLTAEGDISDHETRIQVLESPNQELVINVRDHGAKGDGTVSNETPAIQAAIDAAAAAGGGLVWFPQGNYRIQTTIIIKPEVRLKLAGDAFLNRNIDSLTVMIRNEVTVDADWCAGYWAIEGGNFDVNGNVYDTPCTAIEAIQAPDPHIRDVRFWYGAGKPYILVAGSYRVQIEGCSFNTDQKAATNTTYPAVYLTYSQYASTYGKINKINNGVQLLNCKFSSYKWGVGGEDCVLDLKHEDLQISNCLFDNCDAAAIKVGATAGITISNNIIEDSGIGIELNPGNTGTTSNFCDNATIVGNSIKRLTKDTNWGHGIWINEKNAKSVRDVTINGNAVRQVNGVGIYVQGSPYCAISGNTVRESGYNNAVNTLRDGIRITGTTDFNISGNTVRACTYGRGILLDSANYGNASGNLVYGSGGAGLFLQGSSENTISANTLRNNYQTSLGTNNAQLDVVSTSNNNNIGCNTCRGGSVSYGLYITGTCSGNYIRSNDVLGTNFYVAAGNNHTGSANSTADYTHTAADNTGTTNRVK